MRKNSKVLTGDKVVVFKAAIVVILAINGYEQNNRTTIRVRDKGENPRVALHPSE
jgi:hypothetical protein